MGEGGFVLRAQVLPLLGKFFKPYQCSQWQMFAVTYDNIDWGHPVQQSRAEVHPQYSNSPKSIDMDTTAHRWCTAALLFTREVLFVRGGGVHCLALSLPLMRLHDCPRLFWSQGTDIHVLQKVVPHIEQPQESHSLGPPRCWNILCMLLALFPNKLWIL